MKIVVTCGDVNGIGLETLLKSADVMSSNLYFKDTEFYLACNSQSLLEYAKKIGYDIEILNERVIVSDHYMKILECDNYSPVEFGKVTRNAGSLSVESLEKAIVQTLNHKFDALVTLPISKESAYLAGFKYPGQTEMLAEKSKVTSPLMILFKDDLRVALATIHEPLRKVPDLITKEKLIALISQFNNSLKIDFGIEKPIIAVLGLNPHAGENGKIGMEENTIISVALDHLKTDGVLVRGPYPADGFFAHGDYKNFDGIVAMFHDQGLVPLKLLAHGTGVNFTAGLPVVRTSPDHGTAYGISGKGIASPNSLIAALISAVKIVKARKNHKN
ncbi:MAG: 4-hydroxythreonine-4-phosphate dehydrogenase PdxA [Desulfobulbaceae bacterium]|nr:4-hydroxythreonine-4-phosphate dehydrogenase PdxA [Candidatus Kapabacteria bacterium]MBS4000574.1 4-hydroxythreonine-4-phosphate dehydrogenase PdxA [Desulfobulbaceae bacterium]